MADWDYKVMALPRHFTVNGGQPRGPGVPERVAAFVEEKMKKEAREGWEFYRIDSVHVVEPPSWFGRLTGQNETTTAFNLLIFRRPLAQPIRS